MMTLRIVERKDVETEWREAVGLKVWGALRLALIEAIA